MPLFETIPVDIEHVRQLARDHWHVELGECVKVSQNHTFLAYKNTTERSILRVTPDPKRVRLDGIQLEVTLLDYLHRNQLPVCRSISSSIISSSVVRSDPFILCLYRLDVDE